MALKDRDGGDARNAQIGYPFGLAIDAAGNVYIADILYIRKVALDGVITTLAAFLPGPPAASSVPPVNVLALAVDSAGNVYATDHLHDRVLKISPVGVITPYAGTGVHGFSGDGGPAGAAQLAFSSLWRSMMQTPSILENGGGSRIRKVSAEGVISTIGGTGSYGYSGKTVPPRPMRRLGIRTTWQPTHTTTFM